MPSANLSLDDVLRDIAARGELSHISLAPSQNGKLWRASFAMCSHWGVSFAEDADPAKALILACTSAKLKKPRTTITLKPEPEPPAEAEDPVADLM
jgi:hypothetical protein